ncbi:alpha-methylacyl-CoA racemase [Parasphingorhabdus marina DSM 22363]|uniref:Alpha-methylacyl-CoA racemase n=1 Tax=Parasphingorhabdus marina DSM 22363 TaxID=1123272 RepID=A0A1N6D5T2_9SPHN|nr:CaiB/BaiF CoA-transferase family protein [Parasphingorhabdus marina]SIN66093.1 alpha-methylacyl-CoA racemase [Parasphingorhabdus marina DSM 22363]
MAGPLAGIHIVEFAGIGPGPFCGMMLADQGATVTVLHRPGRPPDPRLALSRSRKLVEIDLKSAEGIRQARDIVREADGLIEGFRPGVMERLGLGPDVLLADNPGLVYGRMTGWGQYGPLAQAAGHDINYISISGALHAFGRAGQKPTPPINMVGDFGGGGMMLALGMVSALLHAKTGGKGQVVDCAMTDGSAALMAMIFDFQNIGQWQDERGVNLLDTGAHFYDSYETSDGKYISIGSIEPQFYAQLREVAGLADDSEFDAQMNPAMWPKLKDKLTTLFLSKTRDQWCELMEGTDICFAPVLSLTEAKQHPHNVERQAFVDVGGHLQPAPAPRYSETVSDKPEPPA